MRILVLVLLLSLTLSCSYYSPIFWGWGEWAGADVNDTEDSSAAKFDWYKLPGVVTHIDGVSVGNGYKKAKLSPGKHRVEYAYYTGGFGTNLKGVIELDLVAGHVYEFRIDLCFWCMPRSYAVWVDDKTTGEMVWGKQPDWPAWWL